MLEFDLNKMLFNIPKDMHNKEELTKILKEHPEIQFVSYAGLDMVGNDTDERIPVRLFLTTWMLCWHMVFRLTVPV